MTEEREVGWDEPFPPLPASPAESGGSAPDSASPSPLLGPARGPRWQQAEIAWPLALLSGFAGSTIGIEMGLPGVGPLVAVLLFAPLYMSLLARGRIWLVAMISVGWLGAVGAAVAGQVLDGEFTVVAGASPGASAFRDGELRPWLEGARSGPEEWPLLRNLIIGLVLMLVARPSIGALSLFGLGLAASAVGAGVGWFAAQAQNTDPALASLLGLPPHYALAFSGLVLVAVALADRGRSGPFSGGLSGEFAGEFADPRRALLLGGLALTAGGLLLEPLLASAWAGWMAGA